MCNRRSNSGRRPITNAPAAASDYALGIVCLILIGVLGCSRETKEPTLAEFLRVVKQKKFVDLTHAFEPGVPRWPRFPDEERETLYWYDEGTGSMGAGFYAQRFSLVGQWGTHVDPPAHSSAG